MARQERWEEIRRLWLALSARAQLLRAGRGRARCRRGFDAGHSENGKPDGPRSFLVTRSTTNASPRCIGPVFLEAATVCRRIVSGRSACESALTPRLVHENGPASKTLPCSTIHCPCRRWDQMSDGSQRSVGDCRARLGESVSVDAPAGATRSDRTRQRSPIVTNCAPSLHSGRG